MNRISIALVVAWSLAMTAVSVAETGSAVATQWNNPPGGCATGQCPIVLAPPPGPPAGFSPPSASTASLPADTQAAIGRITNTRGPVRAMGTGTLIDVAENRGLVITCAHLFRDGAGSIVVVFPDRQTFTAQLARIDTTADLAALTIDAPTTRPIEVAEVYARRGDPLTSCGYGGDGRLWCNRGQALGYVSTAGSRGAETLEMSGAARFGDSGGPVFNRDYELVAVLFGTNGRVVDGTFSGRVRRFLAGLSPRFRSNDRARGKSPQRAPGAPVESPLPLAPVPPSPNQKAPASPDSENRMARLESLVARMHTAWQGISAKVDHLGELVRHAKQARPGAEGRETLPHVIEPIVEGAKPWISAKLTTVLISLGVPGGIAGLAAGAAVYLAMRRGKRRLQAKLDRLRRSTSGSAASSDASGSSDEPVIRHHNRYVPYEMTELDRAWSSAHAQVGEKYPGAVAYLKMAEGVKDQLLSGNYEQTITEGRLS